MPNKNRNVRKTLIVGLAMASVGLGLATSADAAEASSSRAVVNLDGNAVQLVTTAAAFSCDNGYLCLYEKNNGKGRHLQFHDRRNVQNLTDYGFNDKMSSWRNRTADDAFWYDDVNRGGTAHRMSAGARTKSLGGGNDKASSIYIT